jgi:predicted nucleic acid-binding protein
VRSAIGVIVVDASAVLELLLNRPSAPALRRLLLHSGELLHAPHLIDVEVLQVIRRYLLAGNLDEKRATEALSDHLDLPIERYPHEVLFSRIWQLRTNLTAYDAAYVALAEALDAILVTADVRLARGVPRGLRVEVVTGRPFTSVRYLSHGS